MRGPMAPIVPKRDWPRANENATAAEERKAADAGMPPPSATNSWARDWRLDTKAGGKGLDLAAAAVGKWPRGTLPRRAASRRYGTRRPLHPKPMQARIPTWSLVERPRGPLFSLCPHCARCEISPVMPARSALPNTHTNTHRGHTHRHASDRSGGLHRKCTEKGARQAEGRSCQSRALDSS
jgi:hypothetical protein